MTHSRKLSGLVIACLSFAVLGGCAVGPSYRRPVVEMPPAYRGEDTQAEATSVADLPWWELFQDTALKGLIEEALANNYDLRIAASRVEQARYAVGVTRADLMPQVDYQGDAQRGRFMVPGQEENATGNSFLGAFQMAWELDIWGRIRRATEASLADLFAAEDVRRGVLLSLVTTTAQAYLELRELDLELEIAKRTRDAFEQTRDLFLKQFRGGVGNMLEVSRAEGALNSTAAVIPDLERQIVAKENQICLLLGRAPGPIPRGAALTAQTYPPSIPAGLPSSLLERRPDIMQVEQNIIAANALVGVSIADFLPRIGLTSLYGGQSSEIENVVKGRGNIWGIEGSLLGPIFQGGRLYYSYKGSVAAREDAILAYHQAVLTALGEVSNALVTRERLAVSRVALEKQVAALQDAVRLATLRYTGGLASYFEVLEAQQQLFPAENQLARTELIQLVSVVNLYRALGGGWRAEEQRRPQQYPLRREVVDKLAPGHGHPE